MKIFSWIKKLKKDFDKTEKQEEAFNKKNKRLIERSLLSRLRTLGLILLGFALAFFVYAVSHSPLETPQKIAIEAAEFNQDFDEITLWEDLSPDDTLNFYIVALIFATLGAACVFTVSKRRKKQGK